MTLHINFYPQQLTVEEADGLVALVNAMRPAFPTMKEIRDRMYAQSTLGGAGYSPEPTVAPVGPNTTVTETRIAAGVDPTIGEVAAAEARRERGKPAPGRARRTKEEIAEDEAADKAEASRINLPRETVERDAMAISTGGDRVGPEDEPEVQEQDKADEQAEVEAEREPEKELTVDDVRGAMSLYVKKFELPATQEDGPTIFADALGTPPNGEPFWKLSLFAGASQDVIKKAVAAWTAAAAADGRYKKNG